MERFPVDGGHVVLQRTERVERRAAVGTPFRGGVATGARRRRRRFVPVARAAHGRRRFLEPGQMIVHVHLDLDVGHERLPAYGARRGERHLPAAGAGRTAVFLQVLVELFFALDGHLAVAAHRAGGHLRGNVTEK